MLTPPSGRHNHQLWYRRDYFHAELAERREIETKPRSTEIIPESNAPQAGL
jgi:hypothetical protein